MAHDGPRPGAPGRPSTPGRPAVPTAAPQDSRVTAQPTVATPGLPPPDARPVAPAVPGPAGVQPDAAATAATVDAGLATLSDLPLDRHPEVYARLHGTLTDALAATTDPGR